MLAIVMLFLIYASASMIRVEPRDGGSWAELSVVIEA